MEQQDEYQHFIDPYAAADNLGLTVIRPKNGELLIDLDSADDRRHMEALLAVLGTNRIASTVRVGLSRRPGHYHAYVQIEWPKKLNPVLRIALQACLGSDRKRELLSLLSIATSTGFEPTVFFEPHKD